MEIHIASTPITAIVHIVLLLTTNQKKPFGNWILNSFRLNKKLKRNPKEKEKENA